MVKIIKDAIQLYILHADIDRMYYCGKLSFIECLKYAIYANREIK